MDSSIQQYLVDMEMLAQEAENIVLSAEDKPIHSSAKEAFLVKIDPVLHRMKPLQEFQSVFPDDPRWAHCAEAFQVLSFHMQELMQHNKRVIQI
jgi:hypothetical protein